MPQKIAIIEDDPDIRQIVRTCLENSGFDVSAHENGQRLDYLLQNKMIDLAIVDLNLPGENGLDLVGKIRNSGAVGVIILTGQSQATDRVVGLELGADDYITKPFESRELVARVRAVLRRMVNAGGKTAATAPIDTYKWAGWAFDTKSQSLTSPDGMPVELTGGEIRLLNVFLANPNRVLSREQIIEMTSPNDSPAFDRSIDVRIARLRKKLSPDDSKNSTIRTIRNYGYIFAVTFEG